MKKFIGLIISFIFLTGCSAITEYNKALSDYEGSDRVGIAFDVSRDGIMSKMGPVRIYPETIGCIDLSSSKNGFLSGNIFGGGEVNSVGKKIGIPEVNGMAKDRVELWVSAKHNIAIRTIYTGQTGKTGYFSIKTAVAESVVTFKPEPGTFYYVTINFDKVDPITGKYMRVYKIIDDGAGRKSLKHVSDLKISNCPGQHPWYQKSGAVM
ncbi:hypothetical protein SOASR032_05450 [Pragia fontium]|uniref:Lipoprotein n=1 Tax=Pragia fontium TaxID=82985 RepID=A0ABQ5LG95_9GAMM|nr:hypothetical protein [Pragia fontium]GKX61976.1 hypothetical protein SOASR032_05450 [Pragia fontium]